MQQFIAPLLAALAALAVLLPAAGCGARSEDGSDTLRVAAFSVVREVYDQAIFPAFARHWQAKTGRPVRVEASYGASGAQSRAVTEGLEADVVVLSMPADVDRLRKAGLVTSEAEAPPRSTVVSRSIVALAVRPGNPKGIRDWPDLARADVAVLTPNPRTSGGAVWNMAALWGAALRGRAGVPGADPDAARDAMRAVLARVDVMDRSGRDSIQTFERGLGDVAITYENEIAAARRAGRAMEQVTPLASIRIDNPAAVVDAWADKHGRRSIAEGFVGFLAGAEAQRAFASFGLRPVDAEVARETAERFAPVADLFSLRDLGGWSKLQTEVFGAGGHYARALEDAKGRP